MHPSGLASLPGQQLHKELQNQGLGDAHHHSRAETQLWHPPQDQGRAELLLTLSRLAAGISQRSPAGSEQPSSAWIAVFLIILINHRGVLRWRPGCCWEAELCLLAVTALLHCHCPQSDRTRHQGGANSPVPFSFILNSPEQPQSQSKVLSQSQEGES